jgi:hypothetical protein
MGSEPSWRLKLWSDKTLVERLCFINHQRSGKAIGTSDSSTKSQTIVECFIGENLLNASTQHIDIIGTHKEAGTLILYHLPIASYVKCNGRHPRKAILH